MICPHCEFEQPDENRECPKCGIVFEKYFALQKPLPIKGLRVTPLEPLAGKEEEKDAATLRGYGKELFLFVNPRINPLYFGGRVVVFLIIFIWGLKFIFTTPESNYTAQSFMHLVNLPFHEAGHIIFSPFGRFIMMLGGTLGQLFMPLTCFLVLLLKTRDTFGAAVSMWWFGENFMDIAPYINDARALKLMLLGGVTGRNAIGYHDWEFILRKLGWLQYDHTLAYISYTLGILLMLITFVWAGYLLFKQFKNLDLT